jgi:hypothetical protein
MKFATFLLAPVVVGAIAVPLEKRQLGTNFQELLDERGLKFSDILTALFKGFLRSQKSYKVEKDLSTKLKRENAVVKRMKITYGPYKIKGLKDPAKNVGNTISMDVAGTAYNHMASDFPKDITVLNADSIYVHQDGTPATFGNSGLFSHHLVAVDWSKAFRVPTIAKCPTGKGVEPPGISFISGSAEDKGGGIFSTMDGNYPSGYYIGPSDQVALFLDMVNYRNETRDIYSMTDITYIEGKPKGTTEAAVQLWDVAMCDGNSAGIIHQPKNVAKFSVISQDMIIAQDGVFLNFRGHLHDGGTNLTAKINGKEVCASKAIYTAEGVISDMEYCSPTPPIKVKKGDTIKLQANYDLDLHPPRKQVDHSGMAEQMALMAIYFTGPDIK